jgi:hypothetical protein
MAGGVAWTSLDVPEVDRVFNFRNHHISNAGTRGENLGITAGMLIVGVHRVLR